MNRSGMGPRGHSHGRPALLPADHATSAFADEPFHPARDNWLREHKLPCARRQCDHSEHRHGWQFTRTGWERRRGERLPGPTACRGLNGRTDASSSWQVELARAWPPPPAVPFIFAPLEIAQEWGTQPARVSLMDDGCVR